jgi:hypothetical protein
MSCFCTTRAPRSDNSVAPCRHVSGFFRPLERCRQLNLARAYALQAGFAFGSVGAGLAPPATPGAAPAQSVDANTALAKARTTYQDFFALWKDADPETPS